MLACGRAAPPPEHPPAPQIAGTIVVAGLTAPVRIVRDRWGVPHVHAENTADLFFAQGFVQAQDRLFQMDLWRRASLGRLSEILGVNFVDRDAMTRRIQYRGDPAAEWARYGPDAKPIAEAFVRGVNAWVSIVRERPPEEFAAAGWPPAYWSADDLLNRTDAFLDVRDAVLADVARLGLPDAVRDAVRLAGTPPFLIGSTPPDDVIAVRAVSHAVAVPGSVVAADARRTLSAPSPRYLVHLTAPGWNVSGATAPWLPGVAMGHDDRIAWGLAAARAGVPQIVVDDAAAVSVGPKELIRVKGRAEMVSFTRDTTPRGLVIASDAAHHRAYVLRWDGFEPGGASEFGAVALDRAQDAGELRAAAAAHWRLPARRFVYADVDGRAGAIDLAVRANAPGDRDPRATPTAPVSGRALFAHVLGITEARRRRFDVGPMTRPADDSQLQLSIDTHDWDRSSAINAPGQSGSPSSAHYADGAGPWSRGERHPFPFTDAAVAKDTEATLTLVPRQP